MEQASQVEFRTDKTGGVRVLYVAGSVTLETAAECRRHLLESLSGESPSVIELSGVTAMDLSGLQLLHSARQTCRRAGMDLKFEGMPERLRHLAAGAGYEPAFQTPSAEER